MEHYTPKHPLPEEIQAMQRDDTVCQFCGVSYLIHREIKALEDKLAEAEAKLAKLQGCEERERKLQSSMKLLENEKTLLEAQMKDRDSLISMLQSDNDAKILEISQLKEQNQKLHDKEHKATIISQDNTQLRQVITELLSSLKHQKDVISATRQELHAYELESLGIVEHVNNRIASMLHEHKLRDMEENKKVSLLTAELETQSATIQELSNQLKQAAIDQSRNNNLVSQVSDATAARDEAVRELKGAKEELAVLLTKCRQLEQELDNSHSNLKKKSEEFDSVTQQFTISQHTFESRIDALNKELNYSHSEASKIKAQYDWLANECESVKHMEIEREKAAARSQGQTEDMRNKLDRALADLEAFKLEREQMITAHQNRIEDLRESFKRKMAEADKWPEKMEKSLQRERGKHQAELSALQDAMKENFVMEMQIEKQKHQKLLDRLSEETKAEISQLKKQLRSHAGDQTEIEALKLQLRTNKADAQGTEARLRSEIENLKSIISNLEGRLGKLDTGDKEYVLQLKSQLSDKERDLEDSADRLRSQDEEIATQKEQLQVLQDTVSRECEERMELIDALGEAREQLLHLKKPEGGYSSSIGSPKLVPTLPSSKITPNTSIDHSITRSSPTSSRRSSTQAEEMLIFKRSNQKSSRKPADSVSSAGSGSSGSGNSELAATKVTNGSAKGISLRPDGNKAKPLQALRGMDSDQKRKIAAILSRTNK